MTTPLNQNSHHPENLFRHMVQGDTFPCVGAKAALAQDGVTFFQAGDIRQGNYDRAIVRALTTFAAKQSPGKLYISFIVLFSNLEKLSEVDFETHLWRRLQGIHDRDDAPWDTTVSDDPTASDFSMSVGGHGFYVVGLHPGASRVARRSAHPALVFNLHSQFETLRQSGQYERMKDIIRSRDMHLSGSINPMLANFGESSEAKQYSGRQASAGWACPFQKRAIT